MRNTWILGRGRPESQEGETKAANGRAHDTSETISHPYATVANSARTWKESHPKNGRRTLFSNKFNKESSDQSIATVPLLHDWTESSDVRNDAIGFQRTKKKQQQTKTSKKQRRDDSGTTGR